MPSGQAWATGMRQPEMVSRGHLRGNRPPVAPRQLTLQPAQGPRDPQRLLVETPSPSASTGMRVAKQLCKSMAAFSTRATVAKMPKDDTNRSSLARSGPAPSLGFLPIRPLSGRTMAATTSSTAGHPAIPREKWLRFATLERVYALRTLPKNARKAAAKSG